MKAGSERSFHIKTFGCQMNVYDSNRMASILSEKGYREEANLREADVVLVNTCSIRENAENKVLSLLGQLKGLKSKNSRKVLGITGCVGQRMGRTLLQRVPHLDVVMGPDTLENINDVLDEVIERGRRVVSTQFDAGKRTYSQPSLIAQKTKPSEFLTVMKGCDHFCTYCIVPFVRGREKSRPISELIEDTRRYVEGGTSEVTFLGQNINTYGKGTSEDLVQLIEQASRVDGLGRIRYVTSHPRDLTDGMMAQFGEIEKLCPALHLPFQSGSDPVLKRMGRLYSRKEYLDKIQTLRSHRPDIAMSVDVIVGFPGETEEDFQQTLSLLEQVRCANVFLFKYSSRPGTRAESFADEVEESVKEERLARAQQVAYSIIEEDNRKLVGKTVSVLVESLDKKGRFYTGRSLHNKVVHVLNAGQACLGKVLDVEVTEANVSNLKGFYSGAPRKERPVERAVSA